MIVNDRKAAAAGDTPQQSPTPDTKPAATTAPAAPTEAEIRTWNEDLLVLIAEQDESKLTKLELEKFGKKRGNYHPELIKAMLTHSFVTMGGDGSYSLTPHGWREAMKVQQARAALALKKKDDELAAHKTYHQQEQQLLNAIKAAEATLESKKGAVQAAKADLEASHEALAAHVAGGVQTSFLEQPKKDEAKPGTAPTIAADWAKVLPPVDAKGVRVFPAPGCPQQKDVTTSLIQPETMNAERRKIETPVQAWGIPWIVSALWIEEKTGASRANLLPLLTKDEWQQINEAEYGRAVEVFDQTNEARHLRQKGGPWCGLVVRCGRQVYVVGPQSSAVHVVHPAPEAKAEKGGN